MYAPEQGLFQAELFIKRGPSGYEAFLRASGGEEVSGTLGAPPDLPPPGRIRPLDYGSMLYEWVFRDRLRDSLRFVHQLSYRPKDELPSMKLLLRLERDSPLSELAWETVCLGTEGVLPAPGLPVSLTTAFSRLVYETAPSRPPIWDTPLRILFVVSNPQSLQRFDLESVDQELEKGVLGRAESQLGTRLFVKRLMRPTLAEIQKEESSGYHVIHLLAHATADESLGGVVLADDYGRARIFDVAAVAGAIASPPGGRPPHLVFLALPMSSEAPQGGVLMQLASLLLSAGVQSVVVLKAPVEAVPLKHFVERFYEVLLDTGAVDVAVAEGRKRLFFKDRESWDWTWPVLFTRATDSTLHQRLPAGLESTLDKIQFGA